jgi:lipoprotein-releasing system ATP-binding protein
VSAGLEARGLSRVLPGPVCTQLVTDIDLSFAAGTFTVITGPSGSGKSSLLYLLGLLDIPTSGDVLLSGQPTSHLDNDARSRVRLEHFGFVFQFHFLLPEFSVLDNVMLPMRKLGRLRAAEMRDRAEAVLAALDMSPSLRKLPSELSGGQRQRTAIARALANDPAFVLADEPTGALDSRNGRAVFGILQALAHQGRTVIVVTHDEALGSMAERRIHLVDGRVTTDRVVRPALARIEP